MTLRCFGAPGRGASSGRSRSRPVGHTRALGRLPPGLAAAVRAARNGLEKTRGGRERPPALASYVLVIRAFLYSGSRGHPLSKRIDTQSSSGQAVPGTVSRH